MAVSAWGEVKLLRITIWLWQWELSLSQLSPNKFLSQNKESTFSFLYKGFQFPWVLEKPEFVTGEVNIQKDVFTSITFRSGFSPPSPPGLDFSPPSPPSLDFDPYHLQVWVFTPRSKASTEKTITDIFPLLHHPEHLSPRQGGDALPTFQQRKVAGDSPAALFTTLHGFYGNLADKFSKTGSGLTVPSISTGLTGASLAAEEFLEGSIL